MIRITGFSALERNTTFEKMEGEQFDLLVIGLFMNKKVDLVLSLKLVVKYMIELEFQLLTTG